MLYILKVRKNREIKKINNRSITVPSGKKRDSVTCVTAQGQEFLITLTLAVISVKYSYNGKNTYHYGVFDIIGEMYDTIYVT